MDRTGQTLLGKYELTRMLGKGGMGEVWEGEHQLTGRRVAVKVLSENYLQNRKVVARFGREARAASAVHHEGIVEILDQDKTDDGVPFLVMEFLEGESVGERVRKRGKLSQDEALAIVLPLLDALDAAHQAGIIHRDLKPDNVFILPGARGEERIKILDFGISQKADEIEHHLTQEGSVLGTPHYMSPEQARGEPGIDARADLYAVAVLFYECVVGDVPFDAGNYNALLQIILGTPPPSPRSRGAEISPAVEQVMLAALDKKRDRRPPSSRAFHDLLLEAGVQEDDAILDTTTWTFQMASEPPPPLDFDDDSRSMAIPKALKAPAQPAAVSGSGPRRAPELPADPFAQDSGEFDFGAPNRKATGAGLPRATGAGLAAATSPPGASRAPAPATGGLFDSMPPGASAPRSNGPSIPAALPRSTHGGASLPARGPDPAPPRGPAIAPAPSRRGAPDAAPKRAPKGERPLVPLKEESSEPSVGRTVFSWVAAILAIAVLGYVANLVFSRPDPRKKRAGSEPAPAAETAPEANAEAAQP